MRAVSDFLDRVATRAVGNEPMLSPRLPSLFEPAGRGGAAVVEESFQIQPTEPGQRAPVQMPPDARQPEGRATAQVSDVTSAPRPPATPVRSEPDERVSVMPAAPTPVAHNLPRQSVAERASPGAATHPKPMAAGELERVRETHVLREPIMAIPVHEESLGVLLPPEQPVFATRHEVQVHHPSPASPPSTGRLAGAPNASREPVVHVSIGRLEVRAAPSAASTPRRQEAPRTSALDDYLRQRDRLTP